MKCLYCNKEFIPKQKTQKFCCKQCVGLYNAKLLREKRIAKYYSNPKICKCCGKIIPYESKHNTYCNSSCAAKYNNQRRERKPWSEQARKRQSEKLKHPGEKNCKYCGKPINHNHNACSDCKPYTKYLVMINNVLKNHPEYKIGNLKEIYDLIVDEVLNRYFSLKESTVIISNSLGIDDTSVAKIIRNSGYNVRTQKESRLNAIEQERDNSILKPPGKNYNYKTGIHITWDGKKYFFRSSYEENYMKELDKIHEKYEYEPFNIKYYNTTLDEYRYAIPDFYIPSSNTIIEIKSTWTLLGKLNDMKDKFKKYKELGYNTKLLLDNKLVDIDLIEEYDNKFIYK